MGGSEFRLQPVQGLICASRRTTNPVLLVLVLVLETKPSDRGRGRERRRGGKVGSIWAI